MQKVNADFVQYGFASKESLEEYVKATEEIGLWESEEILFSKHLNKEDRIIDIGCGTGRITYALYQRGYHNIVGLDISEEMLSEALRLKEIRKCAIEFVFGDATQLSYSKQSFNTAIFAYNGLMQIPWLENRMKAFKEINRILKAGGLFIFTTHDMAGEQAENYFWREERLRWKKGRQNPRLAEFGDLIYRLGDREMFMHVPERDEILSCLSESGFELVEDFFRPEVCEESEVVKEFSDECRFWIAMKSF